MDHDGFRDVEFAESISANVLGVLRKERFFEFLDDRLCPSNSRRSGIQCAHSYANTIEILCELGMDSEEVSDILAVMHLNGGCCDCEILYNVAEESRLKVAHWKARHRELTHND